MSNNQKLGYYQSATQSVFLAAGALMVSTFPYLVKHHNTSGLALMFIMVAVAALAGLSGNKSKLIGKANIAIAILGFALSMSRAITVFFNGVEEPIAIFTFWVYQILALVFFFGIYFSIKSVRNKS